MMLYYIWFHKSSHAQPTLFKIAPSFHAARHIVEDQGMIACFHSITTTPKAPEVPEGGWQLKMDRTIK